MPSADETPEQARLQLKQAVAAACENAPEIAHARRVFYDAYVAEGFKPEEALELCKNLSQI